MFGVSRVSLKRVRFFSPPIPLILTSSAMFRLISALLPRAGIGPVLPPLDRRILRLLIPSYPLGICVCLIVADILVRLRWLVRLLAG